MRADVLLGIVVGAYGVSGEVRFKSFTENPCDLGSYGDVCDAGGRVYRLSGLRVLKGSEVIGRIDSVADREAALAFRGMRLYVARQALAEPEADVYYHTDLIGLSVYGSGGAYLGKITGVSNFGSSDLLDIASVSGASVFLPFAKATVAAVDRHTGIVLSAAGERELLGDVDG